MASSLKQTIEKQLKNNVPLSEIRQNLREKGYEIDQINKAIHDAIIDVDKKLPNIKMQSVILVTGVVVAITVGIYFFKSNAENAIELCRQYTEISGEISCQRAIQFTTGKYGGTVDEIVKVSNYRKLGSNESGKDAWRIELSFNSPVENNGKSYNNARVFIDRQNGDELSVTYRAE